MDTQEQFWHFLADDRKLQYSDGREVRVGEALSVEGQPVLCQHGLHACPRVLDALSYSPGSVITLVTLGGEIVRGDDKVAAQERTALWIYDASKLLREFACDVAEIALLAERAAGYEPDPRLFAAIEVMRRFMVGEANESERLLANSAANSAAYSAVDRAVDSAANRAAYSAANRAANSAVYSAANSAVYSAANSAVYSAANSAARSEFNTRLTTMLIKAGAPYVP